MDTAIKKAHDKIMYVAQDREALHAYHMREMAIYDYNSGMNASKERGREEGKKEGREESKKEIAVNLKQAGFSAKEIAGFIGKTVEDVNKILEEQGLA